MRADKVNVSEEIGDEHHWILIVIVSIGDCDSCSVSSYMQ